MGLVDKLKELLGKKKEEPRIVSIEPYEDGPMFPPGAYVIAKISNGHSVIVSTTPISLDYSSQR